MTLHCPNGVSPEYYGQGLMTKTRNSNIIFVGKCGDVRKNAELAIKAVSKLKSECRIFFLVAKLQISERGSTTGSRHFLKM